jgi:hypothetical protein
MAKKALCVGINEYPIEGADLRGCVNDARAWASLLTEQYDFTTKDVKVVLDKDATHAAFVKGLKWLLKGAKKDDVLVFTNSSHGTYIADDDKDEPDRYDEAICPYDTMDNPLVDDELRTLFADLPSGVRLTVISDSCHSGTVTRAFEFDRRPRFLNPRTLGRPELDDKWFHKPRPSRPTKPRMHEVLLAGCKANQTSMDATFEGVPAGAFTYYALAAIERSQYRITYGELIAQVQKTLDRDGFEQIPQAEGSETNLHRNIFT